MKFAIISDIHVGTEKEHKGIFRKLSRHSLALLENFIQEMNRKVRPSFVVNLGDAINDISPDVDASNYKNILGRIGGLNCPVYHVIGNHEQRGIPENQLLSLTGYQRLYYSFDRDDYHCVVLFSRDPERKEIRIDDEQIAWLEKDLKTTDKKSLIFVHHVLSEQDVTGNFWFEGNPERMLIHNRSRIRQLLEGSEKVIAVFNGHTHWNKMDVHNGIPYFTIQSLVENFNNDDVPSGCYAVVELDKDSIDVQVYGKDKEHFHCDLAFGA